MTEFDRQLQLADWEGFIDRRKKKILHKDSYRPEPLIIASDEGMMDRREFVELQSTIPHSLEPNK